MREHQGARAKPATKRRARVRRGQQLNLAFPVTWGGRRKGAGRKRMREGAVTHQKRPALASRFPVHISLSVEQNLPSLRSPALRRVIEGCFRALRPMLGMRLVHYSIQKHHLHLIVEATDARTLSRGMQGLCIRIARRINAALGRRGRVFVDRYFERILRNPRQIRACLLYVLNNARRHACPRGQIFDRDWIDACSSALYFDGWRRPIRLPSGADPPVSRPGTWLLRKGWRRHGLLEFDEVPGQNPA